MSRRASWSSKPVAGRVAGRGGFDSHPLPQAKRCSPQRPLSPQRLLKILRVLCALCGEAV
jgi:hypothetical protein